jgi:ABC-type transport system substrate-binding protein
MRSILARLSLASFAILAMGCDPSLPAPIPAAHPDSNEPRRGGVLQLASFGDVRAIDPANITDGLAPQVLEALFAGLVDFDEHGKIITDLADHYEVLDEGKTYRFTLREGARFHDGDEVTAEDVKRSTERALGPKAPNPYTTNFGSLVSTDVEGKYVITYRLKQADAAFLPLLAMPMLRPACKSAGKEYSDTWTPCGAGPFKLAKWDRGREIVLARHEGYFRPGLPYLDGVRWTFHVTQASQTFKFQNGELDVFRDFTMPVLLRFRADERWKPYAEYDVEKQIGGEAMNVEMPPFDNVEFRRAISAAIDREDLAKVRSAALRPGYTPVPPAVPGYDASVAQKFDLDAAREHMKRAGYPNGYPGVIPYTVYKQGLNEYMAQILAQQLAKIGVHLELRIVNYPTFIALRGRRRGAAFGPGMWQQDYPEAGSFLEPLFHSRAISEEDSNSWSFYKNPRVDALIDAARAEPDDARRMKIYKDAQEIICDEAPWAFTHYYRWYVQHQPYVRDYRPHPISTNEVSRTWIDRALGPTAARTFFSKDALARVFR